MVCVQILSRVHNKQTLQQTLQQPNTETPAHCMALLILTLYPGHIYSYQTLHVLTLWLTINSFNLASLRLPCRDPFIDVRFQLLTNVLIS